MSPSHQLAWLAREFERASIRALPLKGPALAALFGDPPDARPARDLDILVDRCHVRHAIRHLSGFGYEPAPRSNGLVREVHLLHPERLCIDLHWQLCGLEFACPVRFDEVWGDAGSIELAGARVAMPSFAWQLVITSFLFMRELPLVERRTLVDLARLASRCPASELERACAIASARGFLDGLQIALALAVRFENALLPCDLADLRIANDRVAASLEDAAAFVRAPDGGEKRRFTSRLDALCFHGRWRDGPVHRLRPWLFLPFLLVLPDDEDARRAAQARSAPWIERLKRIPEVVRAFRERARTRRQKERCLARVRDGEGRVRPAEGVSLVPIGEEALLFDIRSQKLFRLNAPAAALWCALEDYETIAAARDDFMESCAITLKDALPVMHDLVGGWWDEGLIEGAPVPASSEPAGDPGGDDTGRRHALPEACEPRRGRSDPGSLTGVANGRACDGDEPCGTLRASAPEQAMSAQRTRGSPARGTVDLRVRLLDQIFDIEAPDPQTLERIRPVIGHFIIEPQASTGTGPRPESAPAAADRHARPDAPAGLGKPPARLSILPLESPSSVLRDPPRDDDRVRLAASVPPSLAASDPHGRWSIEIDGERVDLVDKPEALAPHVKQALLVAALNRQGFALYLHAAMLRHQGKAVLLPAAPGSGKSCLATALQRAGLAYHSDEVTIVPELDGPVLRVRGVPVAPCIKEPAWPVIRPLRPEIDAQPVCLRGDGRTVRYLPPPIEAGDPWLDACLEVGAVIFPRFTSKGPTRLTPVGPIEMLTRLLAECLALQVRFDAQRIHDLALWAERTPAFDLAFTDFDSALDALQPALAAMARELDARKVLA